MSNATRFYSLNDFLKERHGEKVMKLSLDGGFTCPNRDGKVATGGCIFCSSRGSGDFTSSSKYSITKQMEENITLLSNKWPNVTKYMPYFQAYSSTYAPLQVLKEQYEEALSFPNVVGLAIATRPDCLEEDLLDYLGELNKRTHLWIELGLQTIHSKTSSFINRGHDLACFEESVYKLYNRGIEVVAHMIIGLPYETREDILATATYMSKLPLQGVKMHMLHVLDNAPLGKLYNKEPFPLLTEDEYVEIVGEILKILPSHFVIHRLTGDGDRNHLIAPLWTTHKTMVLNHIHKYLKSENIYQGYR
ncbi:TIGR01212 family radical SAM protein [Niameybacter massiliensis]|uniref:TIGR01212 family radical SAM protein n=1 Tax=Niameybacter massiliensis TaxID=1658108 RepID=UPI0006B47DEF|nr:TIGR01212 family radical SAM protein [Niameybacter massiliensis]